MLQSGWQLLVSGRIKLSENINFYVSPAGNDANNGLTAATPKKTFLALTSMMENQYDFNRRYIYINIAAGTYTGETIWINRNFLLNAGNIYISGAGTSNTIISANSNNGDGTYTARSGIQIRGDAGDYSVYMNNLGFVNNNYHIISHKRGQVLVHNLQLGNTQAATGSTNGGSMFYIDHYASLGFYTVNNQAGTITVTGNSNSFINFCYWSYVGLGNTNIIFSGTRTFTAFIIGHVHPHLRFYNTVNFGGSVSSVVGKKFVLDWSCSVDSSLQGIDALPGNSAGTARTSTYAYYL